MAMSVLSAPPFSTRAGAQGPSKLEAADLAWERGDYPAALAGYLRLLDPSEPAETFESIALRTGELFETIELTREGAAPQFSSGNYLMYESGPVARRVTRIASIGEPTKSIAELSGTGAAFSPDGSTVAYWKATAPATSTDGTSSAAPPPQATLYNVRTGEETVLDTGSAIGPALYVGANDTLIFTSPTMPKGPAQLHVVSPTRPVAALTSDATDKVIVAMSADGAALLFTTRVPGAGRGGGRGAPPAGAAGRGTAAPPAPPTFNVLTIADGKIATIEGAAPAFSGDSSTIVFVRRGADESSIYTLPTADPSTTPTLVRKGPERIDAPALSPTATLVAFQMMTRDDWELVVVKRDGSEPQRLTRDIQNDLLPQFLNERSVLGVIGEARHRRSFLYNLETGSRTRLFHNNTVRTIAPEYSWKISPDGTKVLIVAERDGDTVSVERGVYLMDLSRRVSRETVRKRITDSLAAEEGLRAKGLRMYAPFAESVRAMVADASVDRVYSYEKALFDFDSKHISQPGNLKAATYLFNTYNSFGYEPEYQWFDRANALGGRTANVLATLKGTVNPELIYVVSSHYDSVAAGPGADDDSSGTAALLETARIMANRPQPATIVFASFTGEEAGLLGSREFVRRAVADKRRIVGALNNDMVGWANDQRLDNTIRYSNPGIRDIQHAAALQFTKLITYDALYYRGTDAVAYYEAFGDIVGGIGSYPVLSSPHYHQAHDVLENMNHQLITEVAKTTAATLALLASSPSRLTGLTAERDASGSVVVTWKPSPEHGVNAYLVTYGPNDKPTSQPTRVKEPRAVLRSVAPGTVVAVKAVTNKGIEGWDWARVTVK